MAPLKVAVLGASGVGKYHAREFKNAGTEIVAILGSSAETSKEAAKALAREFGVSPRAYSDLDALLQSESVDAVSVCTPPDMHYEQVRKCLEANAHVLCEKPFVYNSYSENLKNAKELVDLSEKRGKVLAVNTQWPSVLPYIARLVDLTKIKSFSMHTEPSSRGLDMLIEQLSHQISLPVKLLPKGQAEDIRFAKGAHENININFKYLNATQACDVEFIFTHKSAGPRSVSFTLNGLEFKRIVGENYRQKLVTGSNEFDIEDPFKVSIGKFIGAIRGTDSPLVSTKEILENVALQDQIIAEFRLSA